MAIIENAFFNQFYEWQNDLYIYIYQNVFVPGQACRED